MPLLSPFNLIRFTSRAFYVGSFVFPDELLLHRVLSPSNLHIIKSLNDSRLLKDLSFLNSNILIIANVNTQGSDSFNCNANSFAIINLYIFDWPIIIKPVFCHTNPTTFMLFFFMLDLKMGKDCNVVLVWEIMEKWANQIINQDLITKGVVQCTEQ